MSGASSTSGSGETIELKDGRRLGYIDYGVSGGKTLFYFHGHPGSRLEAKYLADQAERQGVRLIGVDRPGLGLSTYQAGRVFLDWPKDVAALADRLLIDRFSVVGFSGGGPYALSCCYAIPDRLVSCGVVSGVGHVGWFLSFLSQWLPWLILPMTRRMFVDDTQAQASLMRYVERWPEPDRRAFQQPGIGQLMSASIVDSMRQGTRGAAWDGMLLGRRSWGFKLEEISFAPVYFWHGEQDKEIPIATLRALAGRIPHGKVICFPAESHMSMIVNHPDEIVATLTAGGSSAA